MLGQGLSVWAVSPPRRRLRPFHSISWPGGPQRFGDPISQSSGPPGPFPPAFLFALAVDSRVSRELHYTKEKLGEEAAYTSQMLIQTARQEGGSVLTPEALGLHLQAALTASKVQVSLYGK